MTVINQFKQLLNQSKNIVFFGGAGVSTASGIPDFRSVDGLYNMKYKYPPETILSHQFFVQNLKEFYRFYYDKMIYQNAKPNACHTKLAELERNGNLKAVITQNIDGLHQMAGSKVVLELHGSIHRNYCTKCGKFHSLSRLEKSYICECGGIIKPDVVLYGETLDNNTLEQSINYISNADLLIVGGTSLTVYPVNGLLYYAKCPVVLINKTPTSFDRNAKLLIKDNIAEVFSKI